MKKGSDLSDVLGAVYFCPEDLLLIRDGRGGAAQVHGTTRSANCARATRRRSATITAPTSTRRAFCATAKSIRRFLILCRNLTWRMAQSGAVIIYYRARFCERLKEYASIAHRECSGGREELGVEYQTVSTISDPLAPIETIYDQLRSHRHRTRRRNGHKNVPFRPCIRTIFARSRSAA